MPCETTGIGRVVRFGVLGRVVRGRYCDCASLF